MLNPLKTLFGPQFYPRLRLHVVGLAEDFWHDGNENLFLDFFAILYRFAHKIYSSFCKVRQFGFWHLLPFSIRKTEESESSSDENKIIPRFSRFYRESKRSSLWAPEPGEISEKMFGVGVITPGGAFITDKLVKPLGLTKEMSVLDLSAGLGWRIRQIVKETGAYVTGLEPDAGVAARGMALSIRAGKAKHAPIEHYVPEHLALNRIYDAVIARETFYRAANQPAFFELISKNLKSKGQLAFTDYILDPDQGQAPAIRAWLNFETLAHPLGLNQMSELWAPYGVKIRVYEDLTEYYKKEVLKGLSNLSAFLNSGVVPAPDTKKQLQKRLLTWTHRMSAFESGLRFYRFYGTKI